MKKVVQYTVLVAAVGYAALFITYMVRALFYNDTSLFPYVIFPIGLIMIVAIVIGAFCIITEL